jgi:hypothetical protein
MMFILEGLIFIVVAIILVIIIMKAVDLMNGDR